MTRPYDENRHTDETQKEYETAKKVLGIDVEEPRNNRDSIKIKGGEQILEKIFPEIMIGLDKHDFTPEKLKEYWEDLLNRQEVRPQATYRIYLNSDRNVLHVDNVNARGHEPTNKYMHDTVRTSIIKTAKQS